MSVRSPMSLLLAWFTSAHRVPKSRLIRTIICPHCGVVDNSVELKGESTRAGLYKCRACDLQFSAMIGTVMESSHVPMTKWALAFHLMAASKKGVSAHQLMRMLGLGSYRTAWFMAHRVREAMADRDPEPLGGKGKTVEI
jgi:transposase-like protein